MDTPSMKSTSMRSIDDNRKSSLRKTGKEVITSPYNKVDIKSIDFNPKPKKTRIKGFPTEIDINTFMKELNYKKMNKLKNKFRSKIGSVDKTISPYKFKEIMNEMFPKKLAESLRDLIYKRFRPLKFSDDGRELDNESQEMLVIDMMIGLGLLSTAIPKYSDKLRLIFSL